jgi:hypothetical protein
MLEELINAASKCKGGGRKGLKMGGKITLKP